MPERAYCFLVLLGIIEVRNTPLGGHSEHAKYKRQYVFLYYNIHQEEDYVFKVNIFDVA